MRIDEIACQFRQAFNDCVSFIIKCDDESMSIGRGLVAFI